MTMKTTWNSICALITFTLLAGTNTLCSAAQVVETPNPFFAMDTSLRDGKTRTPEEQAALLKSLGYAGIGASGHISSEFLRAFEAQGLRVFNTYLTLSFDTARPGLDPELKAFVPRLKGHRTDLWVAIQQVSKDGTKLKPSSEEGDAAAVVALRELAELAHASGVRVALYPHTWFWLERVEDALRVAVKVDRPNVGATFNLCHWLKVEGDRDPLPLLREAGSRLFYVSINGADAGETKGMGWDRLIQPLGHGTYDVGTFLKRLQAMEYKGPVGFQGYGIKGDSTQILSQTMNAWRTMTRQP